MNRLVLSRIFFFHSTMHGLKSAFLLDFYSNCKKNGFGTLLLTHKLDRRYGCNVSASRIGQKESAIFLDSAANIFFFFFKIYKKNLFLKYIIIDEIQFLTKNHINQMLKITALFPIFIICFGLRTDFLKRPFLSSGYLLTKADCIAYLISYCFCGKNAIFNLRFNKKKQTIKKYGRKILIGGSELYTQSCRQHSLLF